MTGAHDVIEVLGANGHLTVTWDPSVPAEVIEARAEVEQLRMAGYTFFVVAGSPGEDEVEQGNGYIIVKRIEDPTVQDKPVEPTLEPPKLELIVTCTGTKGDGTPCTKNAKPGTERCGFHPLSKKSSGGSTPSKKPKKNGGKTEKTSQDQEDPPTGRRTVAIRRMGGG